MKYILTIFLSLIIQISFGQTNKMIIHSNINNDNFSYNLNKIAQTDNISLSKILVFHKIQIPKPKPKPIILIPPKFDKYMYNHNSYISNKMKKWVGYYKDPYANQEPSKLFKAIDSAIEGNSLMTSVYLVGWLLGPK